MAKDADVCLTWRMEDFICIIIDLVYEVDE